MPVPDKIGIKIRIVAVLVVVCAWLLFEYSRQSTFEKVMTGVLAESEGEPWSNIDAITVSSTLSLLQRRADVTIEDADTIRRLMEPSMPMKLKRVYGKPRTIHHVVTISTERGTEILFIDSGSISVKGKLYSAYPNSLYDSIRNENLDWTISEQMGEPKIPLF